VVSREALLAERDTWKRAETASIVVGDLRAAYEAHKELVRVDNELAALKRAEEAERHRAA
jgi:hypothetical protein